jgi:hypothetical protein
LSLPGFGLRVRGRNGSGARMQRTFGRRWVAAPVLAATGGRALDPSILEPKRGSRMSSRAEASPSADGYATSRATPDHRGGGAVLAIAECLPEFRCAGCGYGATCRMAPERCPMCGGAAWEYRERVSSVRTDVEGSK